MNRNLYIFGMFILGLSAASSLLDAILYLIVGSQKNVLESFLGWYLAHHFITLIATLILLKYYYQKKYWFTFYTGILNTVAALCLMVVVFNILTARELISYLPVFYLLLVATGVSYGVSLIFSKAGKRPWLRGAGVFILITLVVAGSSYIWGLKFTDSKSISTLEKIHQWTSLFSSFIPVLFILNFRNELTEWATEENVAHKKSLDGLLKFGGVAALLLMLFFGTKLAIEGHSKLYWDGQNYERAKELANLFEARHFISSRGDSLPYRILKPIDYDPQQKYPLVVSLHHGGVHGSDNVSQLWSYPTPSLSDNVYRRAYPAFLFVPQCPEGKGWGGIPTYPSIDSLLIESILALDKEFSIDEQRRYVAGVSGGGYGSWHLISIRPEMFAAAIPVCGAGNPALAKNFIDVPVWAFHGEEDKSVPVKGSRDMIAAMKEAGGNPKYTEFSNTGHNIGEKVKATSGVFDWLFAQKRD